MYHQNNLLYDSVGRRLSTNPFRQIGAQGAVLSTPLSNSAFDEWVQKNRGLMSDQSDEEEQQAFQRPSFPSQTRTGSDTNVNYSRTMSSNNPFASAMNGEYKHHRDPPPPPPAQATRLKSPSKDIKSPQKMVPPPPSYEEAAGPKAQSKTYPKEKESLKLSLRSSRPHRSHSDSAKHKERKSRHKSKESKKKAVAPHQPKNLDVIDKLDVSAFFGGRFHHDGPFDACAPHRNKNVKAAPVMAFPADGPNNSMKANAGPKDNIELAFGNIEDHNMIIGRSARLHSATKGSPQAKPFGTQGDIPRLNPSVVAFDAHEKAAPIHGFSTAGLGSTTFLNGAPAPKLDDSSSSPSANKGGLGRKKSLAQRLRKNSGSDVTARRGSNDSSTEYRSSSFEEEEGSSSLLLRVRSLKVGRK
ncbi:Pal1-domain-containing protein [Metschnikowia bicuspidata var. bicuspidata NRRL YB-4993]|uniref:Pal1-domain-containing protein n=1 Tax=Metschnikowia bicuspidata var. bicuspidata NRRL YB-4993 TaxID=869754 RepID=A0A1A0H6S1_9ASCO|nr:Pal1-domain-containing protein [Metschnikowia bicuspidata var. bicuspidata NRRL YB-4993]OBA19726.1 Pal1-domain-containing protein [Metschnikowia bicuspidata var. bicuspidata NRRL YB-4993]